MSVTQQPKKSCMEDHYPRRPYTNSQLACYNCEEGCDKPGIGHPQHDPGKNKCGDCDLCCIPIYIPIDILCFIPRIFGFFSVENPN